MLPAPPVIEIIFARTKLARTPVTVRASPPVAADVCDGAMAEANISAEKAEQAAKVLGIRISAGAIISNDSCASTHRG